MGRPRSCRGAGTIVRISFALVVGAAGCGSARERGVRVDAGAMPGPSGEAGGGPPPDGAPADRPVDRPAPDEGGVVPPADMGPPGDRPPADRPGDGPPADRPPDGPPVLPPDGPRGCPTACCADSDCAGNYACLMGTCSATTCRMGFKRCAAACIDNNACCPAPESCFNGADDDCDGNPDCADSDCMAATMCVPDPGVDFKVGVQLANGTAACPATFNTGRTVIRKDPQSSSPSCEGCVCGGPTIDCTIDSFCAYSTSIDDCNAMSPLCDQPSITPPSSPGGCFHLSDPIVYHGFRPLREVGPLDRRCTIATGMPRIPPIAWGRETAFCQAQQMSRAGCPGGNVCVPRPAAVAICALATGSRACPTGFRTREIDWFLDADDRRSCNPAQCSCEATGGSCPGSVIMAPDGECGGDLTLEIPVNTTRCAQTFYSPGFKLVGTQTPPTCGQNNRVTGTLAGRNQHTLCCL